MSMYCFQNRQYVQYVRTTISYHDPLFFWTFGSPTLSSSRPGKSTLLNVLCGELVPVPGPSGEAPGEAAPSVHPDADRVSIVGR